MLRAGGRTTATPGLELLAGDELQTAAGEKVRVVLSDTSLVALGPETRFAFVRFDTRGGRRATFKVATGKFWMQVVKWTGQ
ncbi:MAG TPA: FecR domain-containing protein, partial [Myxococcota bacterium]|nr:FecR domain-containing protein [Myxococcota bacterium]